MLISTSISFHWRYLITLRKILYCFFFIYFLNLCADCDKEFDVVVNYPSVFTISTSKESITLELTQEEVADIGKPINLFIGCFIITANVSIRTEFTVTTSSPPQYITPTNHFQALCQHYIKTRCTLGIFTNKNAAGDIIETEILNNQVIIEGSSCGELNVYQREIDVYATYIQFEGDESCTCHVPIFFTLAGA